MRNYLLPKEGTFYKANLHSHSTVSDGRWTPEEIKERYMAKGYSVVAYTDHGLMVHHSELTDENFVALTGVEYGVNNLNLSRPGLAYKARKNCDICMIALEPDNFFQPCWDKDRIVPEQYRDRALVDPNRTDYKMQYAPDVINAMIDEGRKQGFFVTYNHPTWSSEVYTDYMRYENMHAMEICNYGSVCVGHDEHNSKIYQDMLRGGKRLFCVATDDNHNKPENPDSFGGFTMIKAEKLEYRAITDAMVKGHFYASEGPEIEALYYEDGKVYIRTSPAQAIFAAKGNKNAAVRWGRETPIREAVFEIDPGDVYFYLTVVGPNGDKAYTNAYFLDAL